MIVDTREPRIVRDAAQALGVPVEYVALPCADFAVADRDSHLVGIERKEIADFLQSLRDGRLSSQFERIKQSYNVPVLVVEGHWAITGDHRLIVGGFDTGWHHASMQMALFAIQRFIPDIVVLWTPTVGATLDVVRALANRARKGCIDQGKLFTPPPKA